MDFRKTSVVDLAGQVRSKKISSRELTQAVLEESDGFAAESGPATSPAAGCCVHIHAPLSGIPRQVHRRIDSHKWGRL